MSEEEKAIVRLATLQEVTAKKIEELSFNIHKQSDDFEKAIKTQWGRIDTLREEFNEYLLTSSNQFTQYNTALKLIGIIGPLFGGIIAGIILNIDLISKLGGTP